MELTTRQHNFIKKALVLMRDGVKDRRQYAAAEVARLQIETSLPNRSSNGLVRELGGVESEVTDCDSQLVDLDVLIEHMMTAGVVTVE